MLILVGVTINVVLKGELFEQTQYAAEETQKEADKEQLLSAVVGAIGTDAKVDFSKLDDNLPTNWKKVEDKTYQSPNGNVFAVDEKGNITDEKGNKVETPEGDKTEIDTDLAYLKNELEGKVMFSCIEMDQDYNIQFKNEQIEYIGISYNGPDGGDVLSMVLKYNNKYYDMIPNDWDFDDPIVDKIQANAYAIDINGNFQIYTDGTNAIVSGLLKKGANNLATTKKLVIPATIKGTNGIVYNVTEIGKNPFNDYKEDIEQLEFENESKLKTIGDYAFGNCLNLTGTVTIPNGVTTIESAAFRGSTSIQTLIVPKSVDNIAEHTFSGWIDSQTIIMKGRTEEPALTDDYSGTGFENTWKHQCSANIIWEE